MTAPRANDLGQGDTFGQKKIVHRFLFLRGLLRDEMVFLISITIVISADALKNLFGNDGADGRERKKGNYPFQVIT